MLASLFFSLAPLLLFVVKVVIATVVASWVWDAVKKKDKPPEP